MRRPSRKGRVSRSRASGSISVSASTAMTSGKRLALMAALSESALPPFSLSITTSLVRARERYKARSGLVGMRSEERRVGKEGSCGRGVYRDKKKAGQRNVMLGECDGGRVCHDH